MQNEFSTLKFKNGLKDGLPIGLGYLSVSIAFGIKASLVGVPVLITLLISMTSLTSAGQLDGLNVIASCGTLLEIILGQLVINARYFLMSISLSQKTDPTFTTSARIYSSAFITDEIYAVAVSKKNNISKSYFLGLAVLPYFGWALGTLIGALAGNVLPQIISSSLGIGLYAMFIAIIVPPMRKNIGIAFAVLFAISLSCTIYFVPPVKEFLGNFANIVTALICAVVSALLFPLKEEK